MHIMERNLFHIGGNGLQSSFSDKANSLVCQIVLIYTFPPSSMKFSSLAFAYTCWLRGKWLAMLKYRTDLYHLLSSHSCQWTFPPNRCFYFLNMFGTSACWRVVANMNKNLTSTVKPKLISGDGHEDSQAGWCLAQIWFLSLFLSLHPDTFASKVAAIQDQYADASIGNVTGSNAVNVFLGIGVSPAELINV